MTAPILLTPGPLTTSQTVRSAMDRDWGSRDGDFIELTARVRQKILDIAGLVAPWACVPLQGSGTFAVEAMIASLTPREGKVLIAINGAYGRRMAEIAKRLGREVVELTIPETQPITPDAVMSALEREPAIRSVLVVHCETTTGILNPMPEISEAVLGAGRLLFVDAMSSFGALDVTGFRYHALAASSNKCLQGVPGISFVLAESDTYLSAKGQSDSLALDLADQFAGFEKNGQWRFTPPVQVLAALDQALIELDQEGGPTGRLDRYRRNHARLVQGMAALGFEPLLAADLQAPIITTFQPLNDPAFNFDRFYDLVHAAGFALYPGKLTEAESFRVGTIGHIDETDINAALKAMGGALDAMGCTRTPLSQMGLPS